MLLIAIVMFCYYLPVPILTTTFMRARFEKCPLC